MRFHRRASSCKIHYIFISCIFTSDFSLKSIRNNVKCHRKSSVVYFGSCTLQFAVLTGQLDVVDLLIELGADVSDRSLLSSWQCTESISRSLLRAGAPGISVLSDGYALERMCDKWDDNMIQSLFDNIPRVTKIAKLDYLLMMASKSGRGLLVKLLIDRGARVTYINK